MYVIVNAKQMVIWASRSIGAAACEEYPRDTLCVSGGGFGSSNDYLDRRNPLCLLVEGVFYPRLCDLAP